MPPKKAKGGKDKKKSSFTVPKIPRPSPVITTPSFNIEPEVSQRLGAQIFSNPWQEWVDGEITDKMWELDNKHHNKPGKLQVEEPTESSNFFDDPENIILPKSIRDNLVGWRRATELYNIDQLVIYEPTAPAYSDFLSANKHIVQSEFIREFICAICLLQYLGAQDVFKIEGITTVFQPSTDGIPWKPWHHVYSLCKAGKSESHQPSVNPNGKYVVRLYFLGCWRCIFLDDKLPVDISETPMLPRTELPVANNVAQIKIELWPFLLCKALLKIASLSWDDDSEVNDFSVFHCLTGWQKYEIDCKDMSEDRFWGNLQKYCEELKDPATPVVTTPTKKKGKKEKKVPLEIPNYVCGLLKDMRDENEVVLPEISPCFSHFVLIKKIQLIDSTEEWQSRFAPWKYFRWISWAIKHNIIDPMPPSIVRIVMVTSFMKNCREYILNLEKPEPKKIIVPDEKDVKNKKNKKADKKEKKPKKDKKKGKVKEPPLPPDPSIWVQLEEIKDYLKKIIIFIKPSQYMCNMKMADCAPKSLIASSAKSSAKSSASKKKENAKKDKKKGKVVKDVQADQKQEFNIVWPNLLASTKNEPAYLFVDNPTMVTIVVSFSHLNLYVLPSVAKVNEEIQSMANKKRISWEKDEVIINKPAKGRFVLEKYTWNDLTYCEPFAAIETLGTTTNQIELHPGRHVFKIWIKSDSAYNLHLMSNNKMFIGSKEKISELMNYECTRLTDLAFKMSDKYYDLMINLGTKTYPEILKAFYKIIRYDNLDQISENNENIPEKIFSTIFEEIIDILNKTVNDEVILNNYVRALRILFLNPYIKKKNILQYNDLEYEEVESNEIMYDDQNEQNQIAARIIQGFFKLLYVKSLKANQSPKNPNFPILFGNLKKIYDIIFADTNREAVITTMFKNLYRDSTLIKKCFNMFQDLEYELRYDQFKGAVNYLNATGWTVITKFILFCHSEEDTQYKIDFYCPLSLLMVKIYDNDSAEEVKSPLVQLHQNIKGYTIIAFGWNSSSQTINDLPWKLVAYRSPFSIPLHMCNNDLPVCSNVEAPKLCTYMIRNIYIPNVANVIARCVIKLYKNSQVSLCFSTCFGEAKIMLALYVGKESIPMESQMGRGSVVIPLVRLSLDDEISENYSKSDTFEGGEEENDETADMNYTEDKAIQFDRSLEFAVSQKMYYVEATVLEDTWPLTSDEWVVAESARRKYYLKSINANEQSEEDLSLNNSSYDSKSVQISNSSNDSPWWELRVFTEDTDCTMIVEEDHEELERVLSMKRAWEQEAGRLALGEQLRNHFYDCNKWNIPYCKPGEVTFDQIMMAGEDANFNEDLKITNSEDDDIENMDPDARSCLNPFRQQILSIVPEPVLPPQTKNQRLFSDAEAHAITYTRKIAEADFRWDALLYEVDMKKIIDSRNRGCTVLETRLNEMIEQFRMSEELVSLERYEYIKSLLAIEKQKALQAAQERKRLKEAEKAAKQKEKKGGKGAKNKNKKKKK